MKEQPDRDVPGRAVRVVCPSCGKRSMGSFRVSDSFGAVVPTKKGERAATISFRQVRLTCQRSACAHTVEVETVRLAEEINRVARAGARDLQLWKRPELRVPALR